LELTPGFCLWIITGMRIDVFCQVIDNYGDVGVSWRLCRALAAHGHALRLWISDARALQWMAPDGEPGVSVQPWDAPLPPDGPGELVIETFGCQVPERFVQAMHRPCPPVWINLEYLSAEPYAERSHGLPSPQASGPAAGLTKWYFYPGFTPSTGGLLRELELPARQSAFEPRAWLAARSLPCGEQARVSLFCYEPAALRQAIEASGRAGPWAWLVTAGRAADAVAAQQARGMNPEAATLHAVPRLTQHDYDHLLWSCDLNFVRGEDSLVRALWAGQAFVWHIYPQHDNAHHAKLEAFLDWLKAPASLRDFHRMWNGISAPALAWPDRDELARWSLCVRAARAQLLAQPDLVSQLIGWIAEKR
jgi:uncharacterized repeat protein (TIGR03837 family)